MDTNNDSTIRHDIENMDTQEARMVMETEFNSRPCFMEYKTYLEVDTDKIEPTEALEKIRETEGVEIEKAF